MNFASLFTGIGGFDLGFERAGMHCVLQVEKNEKARSVLQAHWPDVPLLDDVNQLQHIEQELNNESIAALCGGFPCQDVSLGGGRAGLAGKQSGLWFSYLQLIQIYQPRWVVIENVPGLLSSQRGRDFATILGGLEKCGYYVAWRVLDAQFFGVPQERRRIFVVASLGDGRCAEVLFQPQGLNRDTATDPPAEEYCISVGFGSSVRVSNTFPTLTTRMARAHKLIIKSREGLRRITPLEAERAHGFPDNWTIGHSDTARYKMIGNAVAVPVARWLGDQMMRMENEN